jgi:hypothetical protein
MSPLIFEKVNVHGIGRPRAVEILASYIYFPD